MADDDDEIPVAAEVLTQVAGALAGTAFAAGLGAHDPYTMAAGATGAQVALGRAVGAIAQRRRQRAAFMLGHAVEVSGFADADELFEAVVDDDRRLELLGAAIEAAMRAVGDHKLRVLGAALASGALADDDAVVDTEALAIRAVADLEAPHVAMLEYLYEPAPHSQVDLPAVRRARNVNVESLRGGRYRHTQAGPNGPLPQLRPVADAVLSTLIRHGLARRLEGDWTQFIATMGDSTLDKPDERVRITAFGCEVYERLREGATDASA